VPFGGNRIVANAHVEKLKALGLRHGEKVVVGLSAMLCLLLLARAATIPTTTLTPEQVEASARSAETNLSNRQDRDNILKRLEEEWLKSPEFVKTVDAELKNGLKAADFRAARPWVTPEPGAGLIRGTPELIAPTDLVAYPGRGGAAVFVLDDNGDRIPDPGNESKVDKATQERRSRRPTRGRGRRGRGMRAMMGAAGGDDRGFGRDPNQEMTPEEKKELERQEKLRQALLAGKAPVGDSKAKEEEKKQLEEFMKENGPWKETTRGLRWVVITGVLDHKKMRDNYLAALKNPAVAHPNYKQLDVQRQVRGSDGTWSEWQDVDAEKNRAIVFNLPDEEEELTPQEVRLSALVDPLPFLKAGLWEKVHVTSLVPPEQRQIAKPEDNLPAGMRPGLMGGMGAMDDDRGRGRMRAMARPGMAAPGMAGGPRGFMRGRMMDDDDGGFGGGFSFGGGITEPLPSETSQADTVMIRSLDFTAEPDTTYRYRLRVVVFNPNFSRPDVAAGVDNKSDVLTGPWSEPTDEVTMPADVTAYAMRKFPAGAGSRRTDRVQYQVIRWSPEDGVTVVRNTLAGPGEIVGEPGELINARVPTSDGTGPQSKPIDFNTHQLVLDEKGGPQPIAQIGVGGAPLDVPVVSLMVRPDGTVTARSQASDMADPVRKDIDQNYKRELAESGKTRENSLGRFGGGRGMMGGRRGGK
jgi:hypothetical protein